jgi:hypothetical protein
VGLSGEAKWAFVQQRPEKSFCIVDTKLELFICPERCLLLYTFSHGKGRVLTRLKTKAYWGGEICQSVSPTHL